VRAIFFEPRGSRRRQTAPADQSIALNCQYFPGHRRSAHQPLGGKQGSFGAAVSGKSLGMHGCNSPRRKRGNN